MNPFPEDYELISFFSQEPKLTSAGVPLFYNTLTFTGRSSGGGYWVRISPAYQELELHLTFPDQAAVRLSLSHVAGITLQESPNEAVLMATFAPHTPCGLLKFRLRPHLEIDWPFEKH